MKVRVLGRAFIMWLLLASSPVAAWSTASENNAAGAASMKACSRVQSNDVAIIVHPTNQTPDISLETLHNYYMGRDRQWGNRKPVVITMLAPEWSESRPILRLIYPNWTPDYYRRKVGQADLARSANLPLPLSPNSVEDMLVLVSVKFGSIGYVRANRVNDTVRVISVNGICPGEPNYPLK
jgi:hypothetical protein